jgi:hypothetical protein
MHSSKWSLSLRQLKILIKLKSLSIKGVRGNICCVLLFTVSINLKVEVHKTEEIYIGR